MSKRVETAIILVAILIPLFIYGSWPMMVAILFLAHRALFELLRMIKIAFFSLPSLLAHLGLFYIVLNNYLFLYLPTHLSTHLIVALITLLLLISATIHKSFTFIDAGIAILGIIYIGYGFYSMHYIRNENIYLLILIVLSTVASDTGAYFIGKRFGKRKIAPVLSPNKTIEGSVGGVLSASILAAIVVGLLPIPLNALSSGLVAGIIAIAGQFGDLVESGMKREFKVKDSGRILPGHGGILDRFDSLIFAMTLAMLMGIV